MAQRHEGLPPTSLLLLATALLLFGIGGGLAGYLAGEREGEQRAAMTAEVIGAHWEAYRNDAKSRFSGAIGEAAARLERATIDLKMQVSMYHGCGNICDSIAHQFSEELMQARDAIQKVELPPLADWKDAPQTGVSFEQNSSATAGLNGAYSSLTVIVAISLLCATVMVCFAIACFTLLKLRAATAERV